MLKQDLQDPNRIEDALRLGLNYCFITLPLTPNNDLRNYINNSNAQYKGLPER